MIDYNNYLKENYDILKIIYDNNLKDKIINANEEAIKLSELEGNKFLHSYRFSKVYDVLNENNISKGYTSKIVELLENKYNKSFDELLDDYNDLECEVIL